VQCFVEWLFCARYVHCVWLRRLAVGYWKPVERLWRLISWRWRLQRVATLFCCKVWPHFLCAEILVYILSLWGHKKMQKYRFCQPIPNISLGLRSGAIADRPPDTQALVSVTTLAWWCPIGLYTVHAYMWCYHVIGITWLMFVRGIFPTLHTIYAFSEGDPRAVGFVFGMWKLHVEWLGYNLMKVAWWLTQSFGHSTSTWQTDYSHIAIANAAPVQNALGVKIQSVFELLW